MSNFNEIPEFEPIKFEMIGEKTILEKVINMQVAFIDINIFPSSFYEGDYASIQILTDLNEKQWFRTGSKILITQLTELKQLGKLPVRATIKKVKRYYTLS